MNIVLSLSKEDNKEKLKRAWLDVVTLRCCNVKCDSLTYQHILQGNFGKPAVEKYWDEQIPQRSVEYLTRKHKISRKK